MGDRELVGRNLGPYEIRGVLGKGGMGVVYDAYDEALERRVALKVIRGHLTEQKDFVARFQREAKLAAKIEHAAIASVYAAGCEQGQHFLAMKFVEGRNLAEIRKARGRFPLGEALRIVKALAEALIEIHEAELVHRDIKPANAMLDAKGRVCLMDFGLARPVMTDSDISQVGQFIGTPRYMAPELFEGEPATAQTDIYALGLMLYEMLTGIHPFQAVKPAALSDVITKQGAPPITRDLPDIPVAVARLIASMTALSPKDRSRDARKVVADLDALIEEISRCVADDTCAPTVLAETPSGVRRKSRRTRLVNAAVALVLLVALAAPRGLRDIKYLGAKEHERNGQLVLVDLEEWPPADDTVLIEKTINALADNGAAVIGVDILLDEGSTLEKPEDLIDPIGQADNIVVATDLFTNHAGGLIRRVSEAADGTGFVNVMTDLDGAVRRARLTHVAREEGIQGSLALELYRRHRTGEDSEVEDEFLIDFGGIHANKPIPATRLFEEEQEGWLENLCRDNVCVVGTTKAEKDSHYTPMWGDARRIPGLELQGCILDNLLNGRRIGQLPGWATPFFVLMILLVGFASGMRVPQHWLVAMWVFVTVLLAVASIVAMRYFSLALPMVYPVLGVVGSSIVGVWGGKKWPRFSSRF